MITNDFIFKLSYKDYGVTIISTFFTISVNGMTSLYLKAPNVVQIFITDNITSEGELMNMQLYQLIRNQKT